MTDDANGHPPADQEIAEPVEEQEVGTSRRRSKRIPLEAIVHYQVEGSEFINLSSDISSEGIFIRNFSPPPVGTHLRIKVQLPEDGGAVAVQLLGKVVRVVDGVGVEERGMGVEFTSVAAETQDAVRFFVNNVYELDHLERLDLEKDVESGQYSYKPGPEDVLRLRADQGGARTLQAEVAQARYRLLRSILLVLVGILLGGGFVFLFFLAD